MHYSVPVILEIIITVIATLGVILQTLALIGVYLAIKRAVERFREVSKTANEHVIPAVATARRFLSEVYPDLKLAARNWIEVCDTVRETGGSLTARARNLAAPIQRLLKKRSAARFMPSAFNGSSKRTAGNEGLPADLTLQKIHVASDQAMQRQSP